MAVILVLELWLVLQDYIAHLQADCLFVLSEPNLGFLCSFLKLENSPP